MDTNIFKPFIPISIFLSLPCIQGCQNDPGKLIPDKKPNVLFIAVDDLNDWIEPLSGYPGVRSPNLQKLAHQGISFTNAHCNCAACQPSRNSLFSGLMPSTTGWYSNTFNEAQKRPVYEHIQEASTSLPEYFRQNGYKTLGAGKLYHSGVVEYEAELERLWDETAPTYTISSYFKDRVGHGYGSAMYHPFPPGGSPIIRKHEKKIPGFSLCGGPLKREEDIPGGVMHDEYVAEWAIEKLEQAYEKPFFLALGFVRPHVPYTAPEEFFESYASRDTEIPEVPENDLEDIPMYGKAMIPGIIPGGDHPMVLEMGPDYWNELVRSYLACVSFVDAQIGAVLDALDESPYAENTLVVVWSDHGQHLGEKKHWRKMALWEESTHIPLIFRFPGGANKGRTCDRPVGLIDLYPTLVDLCGLPDNDRLEGRSLRSLLEEPGTEWEYPVVQSWMHGNYAVRSQHFRYIRYRDGSEELYDHRSDPQEWHNIARNPALTSVLEEHRAWIPEKAVPPFLMDSIPEDELDRLVGTWAERSVPAWLH